MKSEKRTETFVLIYRRCGKYVDIVDGAETIFGHPRQVHAHWIECVPKKLKKRPIKIAWTPNWDLEF